MSQNIETIEQAFKSWEEMSDLPANFDGDGARAPSRRSVRIIGYVLNECWKLKMVPNSIVYFGSGIFSATFLKNGVRGEIWHERGDSGPVCLIGIEESMRVRGSLKDNQKACRRMLRLIQHCLNTQTMPVGNHWKTIEPGKDSSFTYGKQTA